MQQYRVPREVLDVVACSNPSALSSTDPQWLLILDDVVRDRLHIPRTPNHLLPRSAHQTRLALLESITILYELV